MTEPLRYTTGTVVSRDGTTIGYRRVGHGPGIIAVHGGGQAAQNLMRLATALADEFTVYLPDRRGRGLSGPPGEGYGLKAECEDLEALQAATGATCVFGLSSGALIALQHALGQRSAHKAALYEPPLSINHSTPTAWVDRFDKEVAEDRLGSAMITAMRGTRTAPPLLRLLPRPLLDAALNHVASAGKAEQHQSGADDGVGPSARRGALRLLLWPVRRLASKNTPPHDGTGQRHDVPLRELVPTMHYDAQLVMESEGTWESFSEVPADVLLLGGSKSASYLKKTLDALRQLLPNVSRVELPGVGHMAADNTGEPELVASELRRFFASSERK
jgi:pimeloyl-ACP methyl ester carboxylesterase